MRHKEIEKLIHKRLDKEITQEEELELFQHIEECAECRDFYFEMEKIKEELLNLTEFFPKIDFNTRVINAIRLKKPVIWHKLIPVFTGIYLAGLAILLFTPLANYLLSKLLLTLPGIVQSFEKIIPIGNGLCLLASSFLKVNQIPIFAGFLFSLVIFYLFGKTLKTKEVL